ncbi:MAG: sulfatase family protein [Myxococcota bacterium]
MSRRILPTLGLAGLLACGGAEAPVRPNLLLVTLDTLRADRTSAYGYARDTTPRLRRLAEQGTRFAAAWAPAPITAPTHATLFTGLHPPGHGLVRNGLVLGDEHATLAETLAAAGYRTGAIVSSFAVTAKFGFGQGFADYQQDFDPAGSSIVWPEWQGHRVEEGFDRTARPTTDRALAWLASARKDEPFFLWVHYFDPHAPYVAPRRFRRFGTTPSDLYDAEVLYTDFHLARLLNALATRAADTLVVVVGDHGEGLLDHGYMEHDFQLYEEALRVPWILRMPGRVAAGHVVAEPTSLVDLLPTVLDLLGVGAPEGVQGTSRAAALTGDGASEDAPQPLFAQRPRFEPTTIDGFAVEGDGFAVREGRFKLIDLPDEERRELYDLEADPGERRDLSAERPETVERLARRIDDWRRTMGRQSSSEGAGTTVAPEDRERLRAMGYAE